MVLGDGEVHTFGADMGFEVETKTALLLRMPS